MQWYMVTKWQIMYPKSKSKMHDPDPFIILSLKRAAPAWLWNGQQIEGNLCGIKEKTA